MKKKKTCVFSVIAGEKWKKTKTKTTNLEQLCPTVTLKSNYFPVIEKTPTNNKSRTIMPNRNPKVKLLTSNRKNTNKTTNLITTTTNEMKQLKKNNNHHTKNYSYDKKTKYTKNNKRIKHHTKPTTTSTIQKPTSRNKTKRKKKTG